MTPPRRKSLPPLGGRWRGTRRMRGKCPAVAPSSVTCGDSFPRGGSLSCGLPVRSHYRDGCAGGIYAAPYQPTRKIVIAVKPRAGHAPPLPWHDFYCPVGRGDPTPPRSFAAGTGCSTPQQLSIKSAPRAGVRHGHSGNADGSLPGALLFTHLCQLNEIAFRSLLKNREKFSPP